MMGSWFGRRSRRLGAGLIGLALAAALAGCETMPEVNVARGDIRNAIARGQLTSPKAATVALVSLEGAPENVAARFRQQLTTEAAAREVTVTDVASARYLVRGYLSAYEGDAGTTVAYVYDVFDAGRKRREQRVTDTIDVPGSPADPWSAVSDQVIASLVGRSADDLAVALGGMPEAQSASGKVAAAPSATAPGTPTVN